MAQPLSESTVASSPRAAPQTVFSDDTAVTSSPPSSPPDSFPWERHPTPTTAEHDSSSRRAPCRSAFSVLGKRKPLADASHNARKRPNTAATTSSKHGGYTQLQISLGQAVQKTCPTCGMEYTPSSAEDTKLHDQFHRQNSAGGCVLPREFVTKTPPPKKRVVSSSGADDAIVRIDAHDPRTRRNHAQRVLDVVQRELGAVPIDPAAIWSSPPAAPEPGPSRYQTYMYVRGAKCIGFLLVERIAHAFAVLSPPRAAASASGGTEPGIPARRTLVGALSALRARRDRAAAGDPDAAAIVLADTPAKVHLGVSRIWTAPAHRNQNVARRLLDAAVQDDERSRRPREPDAAAEANAKEDGNLDDCSTRVAFSQPTAAGAQLARRWTGKAYGWYVYTD